MFESAFIGPLRPYAKQVAVLIFEFGTFAKSAWNAPREFFDALDEFLSKLPAGFRYAVEIRNYDYLVPEYFETLRKHGVAHVFNEWTRMPPIGSQILLPQAFTAEFTVARALLKQGRSFENAVQTFQPYTKIQDENPQAREALRELIERAKRRHEPAYLFVNNRLEGNSPQTIQVVVD
jgi:uncharacterized protein YecE (DUF72 family)